MCSLQFTECCSYMYIYKAPYKAQLDFLQLHLEPHPFSLLQLHFISSIHALVAIHLVIQTGHQLPQLSSHFHPHDVAAGICCCDL